MFAHSGRLANKAGPFLLPTGQGEAPGGTTGRPNRRKRLFTPEKSGSWRGSYAGLRTMRNLNCLLRNMGGEEPRTGTAGNLPAVYCTKKHTAPSYKPTRRARRPYNAFLAFAGIFPQENPAKPVQGIVTRAIQCTRGLKDAFAVTGFYARIRNRKRIPITKTDDERKGSKMNYRAINGFTLETADTGKGWTIRTADDIITALLGYPYFQTVDTGILWEAITQAVAERKEYRDINEFAEYLAANYI